MPGYTPTSQGSAVSFGGVALGRLTSWRLQPGTANFEEWTHVGSTVIGSGSQARVVKQFFCSSITPGGVTIRMFGCPPFAPFDIGHNAGLGVAWDGGSLSIDSYLEDFDVTGSVAEFLVGTAQFKFSGTGWSTS